jgi:peptidoglycan/xylan/chitin deacetylase (PgdA/CDA1 family)
MKSRLRDLWRTVTPPAWRGALVLLYHRIAVPEVDPWRLAVRPAHLDEHLDILRRSCNVVTAGELGRALDAGRVPKRTVAITFDDGYADLATEIQPQLERADLRATAFIVSRAVDRQREFWWDEIERAVLGGDAPVQSLRLDLADGPITIDPPADGSVKAMHRQIWELLRARPPEERDRLAGCVLEWAGLSTEPRASHRTLTAAEFDRLATGERLEIGAHTADHAWLAGLSSAATTDQVAAGASELEGRLGRRVETFAYPHGGPADVGEGPAAARAAGFGTAFMAVAGTVRRGTDRMRLPRLFVEDMDGEAFSRLLWRHGGIRVS